MKIALVQFYSYHEEVLAPQIDFLLPDNEVFVAAPSRVFEHDYMAGFNSHIKKIVFDNNRYDKHKIMQIPFRMISILLKYVRLYKYIRQHTVELIIFNTITKPFHFRLIRFFFKKIEKYHIIHNGQLFTKPKVAKSLLMFKKNIFISFDVYSYFINNHHQIDSRYFDWFFPGLAVFGSKSNSDNSEESNNIITIVVPGAVEYDRRNYDGLFNALNAPPPVQIILLGKIAVEVQREIMDRRLDKIIKTYMTYVPGEEMLQSIEKADAIAFLIDKNIGDNCCLYNRYKASGTSVLALSFGIPCIVSSDFALDDGLREKAIIYPGSHIECVFQDIITGKLTKKYFKELKEKPLAPIYSLDYQRHHYRALLAKFDCNA
jgi:hypothetical protein